MKLILNEQVKVEALVTARARSTTGSNFLTRVCPSICLSTGGGSLSLLSPGGGGSVSSLSRGVGGGQSAGGVSQPGGSVCRGGGVSRGDSGG